MLLLLLTFIIFFRGTENEKVEDAENKVDEKATETYLKNIKLRCEFCHKDFPKRYDLISHRARAHKEQNQKPRLPCPHCNKSFPRNYLRIHMKAHVGAKKKCPHCNYTTPYSKSLKFHISKIHTKEFDYNCDMCGRGFMEKYSLKEHIKKEHGEGITCETCQKTFHSEYYLKIHQETHKPDYEMRNYVCDLCNRRFLSRKMLRQHLLKHSGSTKVYKCTYCNKELSSNASLKAHTNIHTGLKPYVCEICGNGFARRNYLVVHMRTHTREKPYVCQECGAAFAQKTSLTFHMRQLRSHLNQNTGAPLDFICAFCDKGFLTDQILQEHMAKLHGEGASRIVCDICNKTFANRKNLRVHKQSHELSYEERKHQCDVCGKKFLTKSNLFRHIRGHLQTVQFECSHCKKCLSSLSTLKDHEKIHTGEKPFICEVCGKSFSRKKYLVTHSNTHANEKCYSCKECGSSFSQRGALTRHQRSTHIRRDPVRIMENVRKPKKKNLIKTNIVPQQNTSGKIFNLVYDKKIGE